LKSASYTLSALDSVADRSPLFHCSTFFFFSAAAGATGDGRLCADGLHGVMALARTSHSSPGINETPQIGSFGPSKPAFVKGTLHCVTTHTTSGL
jgi:hypothetical protein